MRRLAAVILLAALALAAAGGADAYRLIEHREWNLPVEGRPRLAVRNVRGSIGVIGWDRGEIEISVTIRIRAAGRNKAQRIFGNIVFEVADDPGNASIRAVLPALRKDSLAGEGNTAVWVDYTIRVPRSTDLDIRSVTGDVGVTEVGGSFHIESERGSIDVFSKGGEGVLRSVTGDIGCELAFLPPGGELSMKSTYGDLFLGIPRETGAMVSAKTRRGRVRVRLGMTDIGKRKRRTVRGMLGGGDGKIVLETVSGDVTIGEL